MDQQPRGRGRGVPAQNVWTTRAETHSRSTNTGRQQSTNKQPIKDIPRSTRKFEEACAQIKASVDKHVAKLTEELSDSGSEEDETNNDNSIISTVLNLYGKSSSELGKIEQVLKDSLRSGTSVCLICIASVKKSDFIWSCTKCFCSLHLSCIQRWAKDSIYFQTEAASDQLAPGQFVDPRKFNWCCPKCRAEYPQTAIPSTYYCYCLKTQEPRFDPWLVPHSCGSKCEKLLQPECKHACLLLCHPGPCPPCPQTVSVTCFCAKSPVETRRCSSQTWSCGKKCSKLLPCKEHKCEVICHSGICPPCPKKSSQNCLCGSKKEERPCHSIEFQCDKVCRKMLDCGHHRCETICHAGKCATCPLALPRTCPCGKKAVTVACTVEVGGCGDTCCKLLECGIHECAERCHKGKCGTCWQMRFQSCRCGLKKKELPCYKEFQCETKCKHIKDCRRHPCNRKCCTGSCPPCDQVCNRPLGCKNHKCTSRCHQGPCYPCDRTVDITCSCGRTKITVPCGRERQTKPPKCSLPCTKPPDCHHESRTKHVCHAGSCPPCKQTCLKVSERCGHICKAPCHTSVLVQVAAPSQKRAGPWEPEQAPKMEIRKLPCPPCPVKVPVTCLGEHETADWPCHLSVPSSCGRPCGRELYCTNHTCTKPCHVVSMNPRNCQQCEEVCSKNRPEDCTHPCGRGKCHPGPCPTCTKLIKHSCHCGLNPQLVRCNELSDSSAPGSTPSREQLLSCKDRCPKLLACKHRCPLSCHSGDCAAQLDCVTTVHVSCPCKRIKKSMACNVRSKQPAISCDDICRRKQDQELKLKEEKERAKREEEERVNRIELEQFQRKFDKRRNKDRRRPDETSAPPSRPIQFYFLIVAVILVAIIMAFMWSRV